MPTHALESLTGHYSVGGFIGVLEARSRCSGISAAADSTSPFFFVSAESRLYFFHLLLLGLCLLIPFRFHMQVDDRRHTYPHHHQHDTSVYACAVFMCALYIGFQAFVIPWQAGGDASLQPFLSLTTFLCWAYPMCFLCLAALCPGVIHGSPNSLPAPSVRGIRGTILPLPRGWGRIPRLVLILWLSPCSP